MRSLLNVVVLREVSERRVGVFGGILIFPGFVGVVSLFAYDVFELVLA